MSQFSPLLCCRLGDLPGHGIGAITPTLRLWRYVYLATPFDRLGAILILIVSFDVEGVVIVDSDRVEVVSGNAVELHRPIPHFEVWRPIHEKGHKSLLNCGLLGSAPAEAGAGGNRFHGIRHAEV